MPGLPARDRLAARRRRRVDQIDACDVGRPGRSGAGVAVDDSVGRAVGRGELERLVDAEGTYYDRVARGEPALPERESYAERHERHESFGHGHGKRRKKKSFLDDIFDFG